MQKNLLRIKDVAKLFGVSPTCITNWTKQGILKKLNTDGCKTACYSREEIEKLLPRYANYKRCKRCNICGRAIINWNTLSESGICERCLAKFTDVAHKINGETLEHSTLKITAQEFLRKLGCNNTCEEFSIYKGSVAIAKVDAFGTDKGRKIVVECGGSTQRKLKRLYKLVDEIYILPYGEEKPYRWNPEIRICSSCGHQI